jgi:aspartate/methionine/tyrosine aminotransferase
MSHVSASRRLAEQGIPHIAVGAGFSLWIDLGGWLPTRTFPAEEALWRRILRDARVNILPGKAFGCAEPGWFRLCHATDSTLASIFHAAEVPV